MDNADIKQQLEVHERVCDQRHAEINRRFEQVDKRLENFDGYFRSVDARLATLSSRISWCVGAVVVLVSSVSIFAILILNELNGISADLRALQLQKAETTEVTETNGPAAPDSS